jgi:hypothetical protein
MQQLLGVAAPDSDNEGEPGPRVTERPQEQQPANEFQVPDALHGQQSGQSSALSPAPTGPFVQRNEPFQPPLPNQAPLPQQPNPVGQHEPRRPLLSVGGGSSLRPLTPAKHVRFVADHTLDDEETDDECLPPVPGHKGMRFDVKDTTKLSYSQVTKVCDHPKPPP